MLKCMQDVEAFHRATDTPVSMYPKIVEERHNLRLRLVTEEFAEFVTTLCTRDLVGVADAIADLIYVLVGTAHEFGIPLEAVWEEVQRSNMAKVDAMTGKVRRREDGKILKPDGWTPPDIASILGVERI